MSADRKCDGDRNKALVEAGFAAWSAGTGSPYDLLADDVTWTIVGPLRCFEDIQRHARRSSTR